MNWSKTVVAGLAGGVVNAVYEFIMHGMVMRKTYEGLPEVFRQDANFMWFPVIAILMGLAGALLFARTRGSWAAGAKGGMMFGVFMGVISFIAMYYSPLTVQGFPYYLTYCMGGIGFIEWVIFGAVVGSIYKA